MIRGMSLVSAALVATQLLVGQINTSTTNYLPIPGTIKFNASIRDLDGNALSGAQKLIFSFYKSQEGGSALWVEVNTVAVDEAGRYVAYLGSMSPGGVLPVQLFTSGEARWIGVTPSDGIERTRIAVATVPYAFEAADAERFGGYAPQDFVSVQQLAALFGGPTTVGASSIVRTQGSSIEGEADAPGINADLRHIIPPYYLFAKLDSPNMFQAVQSFAGGARLTASAPETGSTGLVDSAPLDFESSIIQQQGGTYLGQTFRWVSQPTASTYGAAPGRLALLFGANSAVPTPTGFSFNSDGTINFAPGQALPSAAVLEALATDGNAVSPSSPTAPVVNTGLYQWTETPGRVSIHPGANVITLAPCPKGVNGSDVWHYLYITGSGTPEAVLITGGSCHSRQKSGTIEFTAQYRHPVGYSIGSATDGVQEAIIDAIVGSSGGQLARSVLIDPGSHVFRARLSIRASSVTVSTSGATITCMMLDTCIMLGDPSNSNEFDQIVLNGVKLIAGVPAGTWPAIEDDANTSTVSRVSTANPSNQSASFGSLVQVDNDQAATITGLNTNLGQWSRCDAAFCSTAILGPGVHGDAGVIWVMDSNLALNCTANGIDNQNGNTLHVSNSVIQAYPQFGVRSRSTYSNTPNVQFDSVYEDGGCTNNNPLGTGTAGLIVEGGYANVTASVGPSGAPPVFANTGPIQYNYSIVVHSSVMGTSPAYVAGYANTSGTGEIPVVWNQVGDTGAVTYDVLRTVGEGAFAPFGTGAFAVATGLLQQTTCVNKVCSFVDHAGSVPSTYTVMTNTTYWPALRLWPGPVILTTAYDYQNTGGGTPTLYFTDVLNNGGIVSSSGAASPSVFAQACTGPGGVTQSLWVQCQGGNGVSSANVSDSVLQLGGGGGNPSGLKGRVIFELPPGGEVAATHVIALADSNPAKTMASQGTPSWDPDDTYIGYDQPAGAEGSGTQLAVGAPVSISSYIANTGDNIGWGERLTKTEKIFHVPVRATSDLTVNGSLFLSGPCMGRGCGPFSPGGQFGDSFAGSGPLNSNWTVTDGSWSVSNGMASFTSIGSDHYALAIFTGSMPDSGQFAQATILSVAGDGFPGVGVRMTPSGSNGYVFVGNGSGSEIIELESGEGIGLLAGPAFSQNDVVALYASGTTIDAYKNNILVGSVTDATFNAGYTGIVGQDTAGGGLGSFAGGSLHWTSNSAITVNGTIQMQPTTFSFLVPCASETEGTQASVIDSTTNTWGVKIVGGGSDHVLAYCDGTEWTVAAK